ncbi:ATP-binding protein [Arthrobacter oryzae]|uniref:ATP-binding protein n=1 Tax=Arthrobacter oryzae TaxID=409290 RepID=UPI002181F0D9|nr:ATP-binding protein [Arthrobacter oryzae]
MMNPTFIVTKEHRRFNEFANAVRNERTIGICHGDAGVGKTLSARRYANWDDLEPYVTEWGPRGDQDEKHYTLANRSRTVFYTPDVLCRPKNLMDDIHRYQVRIGSCIDEHLHKLDAAPRSMNRVTTLVELLIIDEAERLNATALELLRDNHDRRDC